MDIYSLLSLLVLCLVDVFSETFPSDTPLWKKTLTQERRWEGSYSHNNDIHRCTMIIHSIQLSGSGGMIATFRDENTVMEINGYTAVGVNTLEIRKVTTYNESDVFPKEDDFRATLKLRFENKKWTLSGNITQPVNKGFSILYLDATSGDSVQVYDDGKSGQRLGLAVGIPVTLAVILSIVAVSMIVWAIKKGYLRHVPRTYKHFDDNKMVELSNSPDPNPSVHI